MRFYGYETCFLKESAEYSYSELSQPIPSKAEIRRCECHNIFPSIYQFKNLPHSCPQEAKEWQMPDSPTLISGNDFYCLFKIDASKVTDKPTYVCFHNTWQTPQMTILICEVDICVRTFINMCACVRVQRDSLYGAHNNNQ